MASSYKTDYLNLNRWISSDKPKRADFVDDNIAIDGAIKNHIQQFDGHISAAERIKWNDAAKKIYVCGTYVGNGYASREIPLEFEPSFVVVYKPDTLLSIYQRVSGDQWSYSAMGTKDGSSLGLALNKSGFIVTQRSVTAPAESMYYKMNESGSKYCYIAFR